MPKVSVIMPSFNVGDYIQECMDSVLKQTLQDLEIICVDSGSTDGTLELLQKYEKQDSRIRLLVSDRKSYGYQMNLGLEAARGQYIGIVETDDFIAPEMYEELYKTAVLHGADFVKADFDVFSTLEDGERVYLRYKASKYTCVRYHKIFSSEDYQSGPGTMDVFIWSGIYKKEFLDRHKIRFQETPGAAFQDCGFRFQVAMHVRRGIFLDESFYRYRRDNIGSSTYNKKCVLFNLSECKYLINVFRRQGLENRDSWGYLAREIAVIAHRPYVELLQWNQPDEETGAALEEFRIILKEFIACGFLSRSQVSPDMWKEIRIFLERPDVYEYSASLEAEIRAAYIKDFLKEISAWKQVVLFGSGQVGRCAYTLIRINHFNNIVAFGDNEKSKWGSFYGGCPIKDPEKLIKEYPDAYYLVANAGHFEEIRSQLKGYGIPETRIGRYSQTTFPLDCTNVFMRKKDALPNQDD